MKPVITMAMAIFLAFAMQPICRAADVGIAVTIGEPGFFGHLEIGNLPRPQVILPAPVIIVPAPVGVVVAPVYIRARPGHEKNWKKFCHQYNACGQPVFFVQDNWYSNVYAPAYKEKHGRGHDKGKDHGKGHGRGRGKD